MSKQSKHPAWLKRRVSHIEEMTATADLLRSIGLNSVCEGASCPNISECFGKRTVTFMVLGEICTRRCRFCAVPKGVVAPPDPEEPNKIGLAARELGLAHVVVTSVTRDDLEDGGASHFAEVVRSVRKMNPETTIELLIPDLQGDSSALETILQTAPDILNHNLETIEELYPTVRPQAIYTRSLQLLKRVKEFDPGIYTKSGIMVGLGERVEQVLKLMDDLRRQGCDIITIGQYLRPTGNHLEVVEYVTPEQFKSYEEEAYARGFSHVASGPFVRSSYNATVGMATLDRINREGASSIG